MTTTTTDEPSTASAKREVGLQRLPIRLQINCIVTRFVTFVTQLVTFVTWFVTLVTSLRTVRLHSLRATASDQWLWKRTCRMRWQGEVCNHMASWLSYSTSLCLADISLKNLCREELAFHKQKTLYEHSSGRSCETCERDLLVKESEND